MLVDLLRLHLFTNMPSHNPSSIHFLLMQAFKTISWLFGHSVSGIFWQLSRVWYVVTVIWTLPTFACFRRLLNCSWFFTLTSMPPRVSFLVLRFSVSTLNELCIRNIDLLVTEVSLLFDYMSEEQGKLSEFVKRFENNYIGVGWKIEFNPSAQQSPTASKVPHTENLPARAWLRHQQPSFAVCSLLWRDTLSENAAAQLHHNTPDWRIPAANIETMKF